MTQAINRILNNLDIDTVGNWQWQGQLEGDRSFRVIIQIVDNDEEESDDDGNNDLPILDTPPDTPAEEPIPIEEEETEESVSNFKIYHLPAFSENKLS